VGGDWNGESSHWGGGTRLWLLNDSRRSAEPTTSVESRAEQRQGIQAVQRTSQREVMTQLAELALDDH
jgi:hypothetical protein